MEKTLNINLNGQLFRIDDETFQILSRYLDHVANRFRTEPGGEETIADIETRIAEIFGGGSEPPRLVSREMVEEMIKIMGAPEDYYDQSVAARNEQTPSRRSLFNPNSLTARASRSFSTGRQALSTALSILFRGLAVLLGSVFTLVGFLLLLIFVLLFFFNDAPFMKSAMEQGVVNVPMLLSIVLNGDLVRTIWILSALVILLPLAALCYLGIKLIFKIREGSKALRMTVFITWVAAFCALAVLLLLKLSAYTARQHFEERAVLDHPPKTLWIAPLKKLADTSFDARAAAGQFNFWKNSSSGQLFCTADLNIFASDTSSGWISVDKWAFSNSETAARQNAHKIVFSWKCSGDTLYLDEFFTPSDDGKWNGSIVLIDLCLPIGTTFKAVPGCSLSAWRYDMRHPDAAQFRVEENGPIEIGD